MARMTWMLGLAFGMSAFFYESLSSQLRESRARLQETLRRELRSLWDLPTVGDIRQVGLVAGIELVKDWRSRKHFDPRERVGARVCQALAKRGVLTRPVGDVLVLMPPYCTTPGQLKKMVRGMAESVGEICRQ